MHPAAQAERRNRQTVDGDRAQDHERYNRLDRLDEQLRLMIRRQVRFVQCLHGQRRNEHGADANRTKVPTENGLAERLNIGYPAVRHHHDGQSAEQQDEDGENDEPPDAQGQFCIPERAERHPRADENERGDIEKGVDNATEHTLLCLFVEKTIPGKDRATEKGREEVVRPEQGAYPNCEYGKGDVLRDVRLPVDEVMALAKLHQVPEAKAQHRADGDPQQNLVCVG